MRRAHAPSRGCDELGINHLARARSRPGQLHRPPGFELVWVPRVAPQVRERHRERLVLHLPDVAELVGDEVVAPRPRPARAGRPCATPPSRRSGGGPAAGRTTARRRAERARSAPAGGRGRAGRAAPSRARRRRGRRRRSGLDRGEHEQDAVVRRTAGRPSGTCAPARMPSTVLPSCLRQRLRHDAALRVSDRRRQRGAELIAERFARQVDGPVVSGIGLLDTRPGRQEDDDVVRLGQVVEGVQRELERLPVEEQAARRRSGSRMAGRRPPAAERVGDAGVREGDVDVLRDPSGDARS